MGQSTNAILFYGFCWAEETESPWTLGRDYKDIPDGEYEPWEDRYARLNGLVVAQNSKANR